MNQAYLLIGGNLGEKWKNLEDAVKWLEKNAVEVPEQSAIYETAAWGKTDQPSFLNQALSVKTLLSAEELLKLILDIELKLGRKRLEIMGPRTIDIDILLFNNEIINTRRLTVPHPAMAERRFVLQPLAEIAGEQIHPVLKKTIRTLLDECPDPLDVHPAIRPA